MNENDKSIIPLGARGLQLTTFDELFRFSEFVIKAGFTPRGLETKEKVFLALQYGMELGLSPMITLQNSMVVNNRPAIYGELVIGQIQTHPHFEDMRTEYTGEGEDYTCTVTLIRRGVTPSVGTFSLREAAEADLLNNPSKKDTWGKYKKRMLFWRAFSRAKIIFSDVLKGVKLPHEIEDEVAGLGFENARDVTTGPATPKFKERENSDDDKRAAVRKEIEKGREGVKNGTPKQQQQPEQPAEPRNQTTSGAEVPSSTAPARGEDEGKSQTREPGPFEQSILEVVRAKLREDKISELALLKILARNRMLEPTDIERGLNHVPEKVLQGALDDWSEILNQIAVVK